MNKKFEDVRKDPAKDLQKKNEALENKREELKDTKPQEQDIQQEHAKVSCSRRRTKEKQKGLRKPKERGRKNGADVLRKWKQMQGEMEQNQQSKDLEALRQILKQPDAPFFDLEELMETIPW